MLEWGGVRGGMDGSGAYQAVEVMEDLDESEVSSPTLRRRLFERVSAVV